jgi:hypothetical protein
VLSNESVDLTLYVLIEVIEEHLVEGPNAASSSILDPGYVLGSLES